MKNRLIATVFLLLSLTVYALATPKMTALAEEVPTACIGQGLLKYMGAIIQGAGGLKNVRLLSPAFNLTNPAEFEIFQIMKTSAGPSGEAGIELFKKLWGFAGNTYTLNGIPAMDFVLAKNTRNGAGYNWIGEAAGAVDRPFVFTEFGDFDTWKLNNAPTDKYGLYPGGAGWDTVIGDMNTEFDRAQRERLVAGINYFAALPGNAEFKGHNLSNDAIKTITITNSDKGGINSAEFVNNGQFQNKVAAVGANLGWSVEIVRGMGDLQSAFDSVRAGANNGIRVVLRACVGNSCEFADANIYISFIQQLDGLLQAAGLGPVYVIAGPNEPATERWATPNCRIEKPFKLDEIDCGSQADPEFHSLRPYPTSPCVKESSSVRLCGQDFVVQEKMEFTPNSGCTKTANGQTCTYNIASTSDISLGLRDAQFPIMGNTELVPNSTSGESLLSFPQRVNEYVSWYMNGVSYRAEEEPESVNSAKGVSNIVDFSGPLKKLLPWSIQADNRVHQGAIIGGERHNQIVACGPYGDPQTCYKNSSDYKRISQVLLDALFFLNNFSQSKMLPYVPFTPTEDLLGQLHMGQKDGASSEVTSVQLDLSEDTRKLYFAHQVETPELANLLQKTFVSKSYVVDNIVLDGHADESEVAVQNDTPYCEIVDTKSNPGDKLYGDLVRDNAQQIKGSMSYTAKVTCDFAADYVDPVARDECLETEHDPVLCTERATVHPQPCIKQITIPFGVQVDTPHAYEVFDKYVAGSFSIFKRMYPQVGPGTPVEKIKDIPGDSPANYTSNSTAFSGGSLESSTAIAGSPFAGRTGASAKIYFPHIGSIYEYFLKGIQKALLPWQLSNKSATENGPVTNPEAASCGYDPNQVMAEMHAAADKFGVPFEFMNSIYQTEGLYYRINPDGYKCEPNFAGAVGIMQVTQGTYERLTCPNERLDLATETASCSSDPGKISRCNIETIFEIAARVILEKAGLIIYGNDRLMTFCSGGQSLDGLGKQTNWKDPARVHRIACAYYGWGNGNCVPDKLTGNYSQGALDRGQIKACRNNNCRGDMDYGDFVCAFMAGQGWFNACTTPNNFPSRAAM